MAIKYTLKDIDDYRDRLTDEQSKILIEHCNNTGIAPCICAWYDDMEDFYSDWCDPRSVGITKDEAYEVFENGKEQGEFLEFSNGEIIRL